MMLKKCQECNVLHYHLKSLENLEIKDIYQNFLYDY